MCEQRKHGSVGAGTGNRPGYPTGRAAPQGEGPPDPSRCLTRSWRGVPKEADGSREALGAILRPGNAGSNTGTDQVAILELGLGQLRERSWSPSRS